MTESLQEEIFGAVNTKQIDTLGLIERSGDRLLSSIDDILDLSKISANKIELNLAPTDLVKLCYSSVQFVQPQAQKKNTQIQITLPAGLPPLNLDEQRIGQVLINLLSNAVKFAPDGGQVSLIVSAQPVPDATGAFPQGFLRIVVRDTGIGIAPENLDKLFQPFVQIDSALNRQYEGTGLGLALVKRLVELHGGQVAVSSEVGIGSSFTVDLPWLEHPPAPAKAAGVVDIAAPQPIAAPEILLVEDDRENIFTISSYLEAKGHRLATAENGREALEFLQLQRPKLILMDIQLPTMDGLEATTRIRQDLGMTDIPIVALTALAMEGDRERCLEAGANEYLSKPVKLKQLEAIVQKYLSQPGQLP